MYITITNFNKTFSLFLFYMLTLFATIVIFELRKARYDEVVEKP